MCWRVDALSRHRRTQEIEVMPWSITLPLA